MSEKHLSHTDLRPEPAGTRGDRRRLQAILYLSRLPPGALLSALREAVLVFSICSEIGPMDILTSAELVTAGALHSSSRH